MKIAVYSFTDSGREISSKLKLLEEHEITEKSSDKFKISKEIANDFYNFDAIVFVSSTGIAIRLVAKYIESKKTDPAIIVIDDTGRFTIPILSGHIGGANELAEKISRYLNNTPVITTASEGRGIEAIDLFAMRCGYEIESFESAKNIMTMILNNRKIAFYSETDEKPNNCDLIASDDFEDSEVDGWLIVSSRKIKTVKPQCRLIPKNLNIGMGLRRGVSYETLYSVLEEVLSVNNLDIRGISTVSSIDIKGDEEGLLELVEKLGVELILYSGKEINELEADYEKSDFVKKNIGVYAVSEPCAILTGGEVLVSKYKRDGVTVSVARK